MEKVGSMYNKSLSSEIINVLTDSHDITDVILKSCITINSKLLNLELETPIFDKLPQEEDGNLKLITRSSNILHDKLKHIDEFLRLISTSV